MIGEILQHVFRFFLLVFIQVLVLNQIILPPPLNGYLNPYLYILFILMLPVNINKLLLLILCFIAGLTIDVFSSTAGMHASACLFIGLARPSFLNVIAPREGYESTLKLTLSAMGLSTFLVYICVMVVLHHFVLYFIEAFSLLNFGDLLLRIITSSIATIGLIVLSQLLTQRSREAKS